MMRRRIKRDVTIAWPAADVAILADSVISALAPHTDRVTTALSRKTSLRGVESVSASILLRDPRFSLFLSGIDAENNSRCDHSQPPVIAKNGAWVTLSVGRRDPPDQEDEAAIAFLRKFADAHGGFFSDDDYSWSAPSGDARSLSCVDDSKWRILKRIGFEHAPAIGAIMDAPDVLDEVAKILYVESEIRPQPAPKP